MLKRDGQLVIREKMYWKMEKKYMYSTSQKCSRVHIVRVRDQWVRVQVRDQRARVRVQ